MFKDFISRFLYKKFLSAFLKMSKFFSINALTTDDVFICFPPKERPNFTNIGSQEFLFPLPDQIFLREKHSNNNKQSIIKSYSCENFENDSIFNSLAFFSLLSRKHNSTVIEIWKFLEELVENQDFCPHYTEKIYMIL